MHSDVDALRLFDHHGLPAHVVLGVGRMGDDGVSGVGGGVGRIGQGHQVIGHDVLGKVEPEGGHAVEGRSLVGYPVGQHHVKGGDAVGGHQQ